MSPATLHVTRDAGLLLLRWASAGMMLTHGWPKLAHFAERAPRFSDPLHVGSTTSLALAVFAEVFCTLLVAAGLAARLAASAVVFTMLVAAFVVHRADPWAKQELALLYATVFVAIALIGPGRYSVDARIGRSLFRP